MENASKALLIAAGMLFAIIILSALVLGYNSLTHAKQAELDEELKQEIERFNIPFLAFNKKAMYGTDVISILNLAISNNKKYDADFGDEYYVDVSFKMTKDSVQNTVYKYTLDQNTSTYKVELASRNANTGYGPANLVFEKNKTYRLSASEQFEAIKAFLLTAEHNEETKEILRTRENGAVLEYSITYSGIADFKRKTFKCSKVEYGPDGRVNKLEFEQIQASTYQGG